MQVAIVEYPGPNVRVHPTNGGRRLDVEIFPERVPVVDVVSAECGGFYANELFRQFELVYLLKVVALAQFHHI